MIINSLSGAVPIDTPLKQGFHSLVEDLYSEKSTGNETFCFAPKSQPKTTFTFSAAMKFIMRQPNLQKIIFCRCSLETFIGEGICGLAGAFGFSGNASPSKPGAQSARSPLCTQIAPTAAHSSPQRSTLKAPWLHCLFLGSLLRCAP